MGHEPRIKIDLANCTLRTSTFVSGGGRVDTNRAREVERVREGVDYLGELAAIPEREHGSVPSSGPMQRIERDE